MKYVAIAFLAVVLAACGTVSADLKQDISGGIVKDGPSDLVVRGLIDASWNLNEAVRVGALLPDDPAPACLKSTLRDLGVDPDAPAAEPLPSFAPRVNGPISGASVLYIRARQLERATAEPDFKLSFECKALVGQIVIDAGRAARRIGSAILPGGGVIRAVLD